MCCIFTCCGWMLDLLQRCWIFFMSCCISSAVCCVLLTASTSGIALGYNYSLAEYIDLKETNVSVYIKRGVFDDDIADDMDWRRSGGGTAADASQDTEMQNLRRSESKSLDSGDTTIRSGRRLDDSLYESDNQNKYEGSLMRLTAKGPFHPSPPYMPPTDPDTSTYNSRGPRVEDLISESPPGSLDRLKAIQSVINARRAALRNPQELDGRRNLEPGAPDIKEREYKFLEQYPGFPGPGESGRRSQNQPDMMPRQPLAVSSNPHREAVPPESLNMLPTPFVNPKRNRFFDSGQEDYDTGHVPTFPRHPPTVRPNTIRPSRPPTKKERIVVTEPQPITRTGQTRGTPEDAMSFKDDLDKYKQRLLINQYDSPSFKVDEFERKKPQGDDYEEGFKGIPVRRKRSAHILEEQKPDHNISDLNIITNNASSLITHDDNVTVVKNIPDASEISEHKFNSTKQQNSTLLIKRNRKNARRKARKLKQKPNGTKNKIHRKKRPSSKMKSMKNVQRKSKRRSGHKKSVTVIKNIDKLSSRVSAFINKLAPVTCHSLPDTVFEYFSKF